MITLNKKKRSGLLNRIMSLPVLLMLLGLFAFRFENRRGALPAPLKNRVVVDAGHGGIDPGATVSGIRKYSMQSAGYTEDTGNRMDTLIGADSSTAFTKVEIEASYPGGRDAWVNYLLKTLKYPKAAMKKEIQGTVVVQFIVETDGTLTDIQAISGPEALRAESERVVKKSGFWVPAVNNGKHVKAYKKQPIIYQLRSA